MVETQGSRPGWGEVYFSTNYDPGAGAVRASNTSKLISSGNVDQVFAVPEEPLRHLAFGAGGEAFLTERTLKSVNFALWRVRVFNHMVSLMTQFNARHLPEIVSSTTSASARADLAFAGYHISTMVHLDGIGAANAPGGWYLELKEAVAENLDALDARAGMSWFERSPWRLRIGDWVALGAVGGAAGYWLS